MEELSNVQRTGAMSKGELESFLLNVWSLNKDDLYIAELMSQYFATEQTHKILYLVRFIYW